MPREPRLPGRRRWRRALDRFVVLRGPGADAARQSLVALVLNSTTSIVAGAVLGAITGTLERLPGLLVLVPAAIGLRGNVFSALGNRLSTSIHTGTFRLSFRVDTLLGQNIAAAMALTLSMSLLLAVVAKIVAVALGVANTISVLDLALISIVGGMLASLLVLIGTVLLAAGSVRYGWDLDNVTAPLVSTLGDVLTLPALWLATFLIEPDAVALVGGVTVVVAAAAALVLAWRTRLDLLRRIVRESAPILVVAGLLSTLAGVAIEKRIDTFATYPALLVLVPAFISSAGALGGVLSSRLSTKLHLGLMGAASFPPSAARGDAALVLALAVPVYVFNAVGAHFVAEWLGQASPGLSHMIPAALLGGLSAVVFVVFVAYYGSVASFRVGVDPDTYGIPVVTSSVDFVGAVALVVTIAALGLV
jgi:mgtE-like transporter